MPDYHDVPETLLTNDKSYLVENIEYFFEPWANSGFV